MKAEAAVLAMVLVLCVAIWASQDWLSPRVSGLLTTSALLATAAVVLHRALG